MGTRIRRNHRGPGRSRSHPDRHPSLGEGLRSRNGWTPGARRQRHGRARGHTEETGEPLLPGDDARTRNRPATKVPPFPGERSPRGTPEGQNIGQGASAPWTPAQGAKEAKRQDSIQRPGYAKTDTADPEPVVTRSRSAERRSHGRASATSRHATHGSRSLHRSSMRYRPTAHPA